MRVAVGGGQKLLVVAKVESGNSAGQRTDATGFKTPTGTSREPNNITTSYHSILSSITSKASHAMSLHSCRAFVVWCWIMAYWITQRILTPSWSCSVFRVDAFSCASRRFLTRRTIITAGSFVQANVERNDQQQRTYTLSSSSQQRSFHTRQSIHQSFSTSQRSIENTSTSIAIQKKKKNNRRLPKKEELFRADRVLANRTGKSRSECFELLKKKRVWQVVAPSDDDDDGENSSSGGSSSSSSSATDDEPHLTLVAGPSSKISMFADLRIDQTQHTVPMPPPLLMVFHKPKWVLSVRSDPYERPCVKDVLPDMHPVGRLDYDTSGLLLFSSSGALTQYLLHPKHEIEKEYVAVVTGRVDLVTLQAQLGQGVETTEGIHTAKLLQVDHFDTQDVQPYLAQVRKGLPPQYNQTDLRERGYLKVFDATALSTVRLVVSEGKHRMVRRILNNCGHPVVSLKRERLGIIDLNTTTTTGKELPEGQTRALSPEELEWATSLTEEKSSKPKYFAKKDKTRQNRHR